MARLLLVDGSAFLYRAFYAMPDMHASNGAPTGALYGVLTMMERLDKDVPCDFVAVVFDSKGKNFRHELFNDYKAQRPKMPDPLILQRAHVLNALRFLGYTVLESDFVEADDVIATLATNAAAQNLEVVIASTDKDLMQLVGGNIQAYDSFKNAWIDAVAVEKKYNVKPTQIVDYLMLIGDASDNVPGVAKCGPKTAAKWLAEFGSVQNLLKNADAIKGVVGENLRRHIPFFNTSRALITLKKDVPNLPDILSLKRDAIQTELFKNLCLQFELQSFLKTLPTEKKATIFLNETNFKDYEDSLKNAEKIAIYVALPHLGVCFEKKSAFAVDFNQSFIQKFLKEYRGNLICCDSNYLRHFFKKYGIDFKNKIIDVEIMSFILNAGRHNAHDLNALMERYFNESSVVPANYANNIFQLFERFENAFEENLPQKELFENLEMPLSLVLFEMQENGVLLNTDLLKKQSDEMAERLKDFEREIFNIAGKNFNINSPQQLSDILFNTLNLPHGKKTKSGIYSTNEEVLSDLSWHPLPDLILKYRTLAKLKNTYTDKLPQMVDFNFRIHTHFKQTGAVTGRLSSAEPNLQNIPIRTLEGKKIRQAFIAPIGKQILSADYSQIELRIMAHLSGDLNLIRAFQNKADIHKISAAQIFKIPLASVDENQRRIAKSINFGLIYGMSSFGLSKQLNITVMEAENYMGRYFNQYPQVLEYMEKTRECAIKNGYVETIFGRRLYLPDLYSENMHKKKAAERAAINAPLQGSAADLIKRAMIKIAKDLKETNNPSLLILQVHDELILEVPKAMLEETQHLVVSEMCAAAQLKVPLEVSIGTAQNWADAH